MTASAATKVNLREHIEAVEDALPDILPNADDPDRFDRGHDRLAMERFLPQVLEADPRMRAVEHAIEILLEAIDEKLDTSPGHSVSGAIQQYWCASVRSVASLAPELDRWIAEELARPGGAEMLEAVWNTNGLPDAVSTAIIARAGVADSEVER